MKMVESWKPSIGCQAEKRLPWTKLLRCAETRRLFLHRSSSNFCHSCTLSVPWAVGVAGFIEVVKEGLMPYGDAGSGTLDLNNSHALAGPKYHTT